MNALAQPSLGARVAALDWEALAAGLDRDGCAVTAPLLTAGECAALAALYDRAELFRSRVVMARHGFGQGEYQYLAYPLPEPVAALREALYARLAPIANGWERALGSSRAFPATLAEQLDRCHEAGQTKPTPLLLRYGPGDFNCLHQDLYGDLVFPIQAVALLSRPGADFTGGELVLTEQRPRQQSRAHVLDLAQGTLALFAVNQRPVRGARGISRARMRHGVSRLRSGARVTLGLIFHDAR